MPAKSSYKDRFGFLVLSFVFVSGSIFIFFMIAKFYMKSIAKTTNRFTAFLNAVWSNLCVSKTFTRTFILTCYSIPSQTKFNVIY